MLSEIDFQSLLIDLDAANKFIQAGENKKSRVIARQVAGKAIKIIFSQKFSGKLNHLNPYQCIEEASKMPDIFQRVLPDIEALTTRVNTDYSFPEELDLVNSAKNILLFVKDF